MVLGTPVVGGVLAACGAQWFRFGREQETALKRSNSDKQRAVKAALMHPKCSGLSNKSIAAHVGVNEGMIRTWLLKLTSEVPKSTLRTGSDGRTIKRLTLGGRHDVAPVKNLPSS
jgi:hypothetical protein